MDNKSLKATGAAAARLYKPDGSISPRHLTAALSEAIAQLDAAYKSAEAACSNGKKPTPAAEWLLDNRYLARREAKIAAAELKTLKRLRVCGGDAVSLLLCRCLLKDCDYNFSPEACRDFLTGVQSVTVLPQQELYLIPAILRCELIVALGKAVSEPTEDDTQIPVLIRSLRSLSDTDMQSLLESVDVCEKLLLQDPSGIYPRMESESRAYYRSRLCALARKQKTEEFRLAENIISRCREAGGKARHVGFYLLPRSSKSGAGYIAANLLFSLGITLLCGFLSHSALAALLLFLPITETMKSLLDNVFLHISEPVRLPRLDLSAGLPPNGKTVCVISALLTERSSAEHYAEALEDLRLQNRSCGKNLSFGILADLPEAGTAVTDKDEGIISSAIDAVEALNKKYGGGFYLFIRPRHEDKKCRRYSGYERKRGAVLALAKLLTGEESELKIAAGNADALTGTRFIITLDSDTKPYPDSLTELICTMLHPMNAPVLDKERGIVTEGHGILHPRMSTTLSSASATDFSRIFAGVGGSEPYSILCGELYMDLFHRGGFSGKGIIDARCLVACSEKHIPNGKILSHDAPEGAYLRGGFVSDIEFSDSFPASPVSYYRRSHRWIRGDWQNSGFIFRKSSLLPDIERFRLWDSLRRSLVPVMTFFSVILGLLYPNGCLILAAAAALLSLCTRLFIALTEYASLSRENTRLRYHSRLYSGLASAFLQTLFRLWFLPYEAWISLSAIFLSLWRMLISHRNLLQWETSAQSELKKRSLVSYLLSMWLCPVSGAALLIFSPSVFAKAAGLFWLLAPLCALALSVPAKASYELPEAERSYLTNCAGDIWHYFEDCCTAEDNFLPPDNFQEQPPIGLAHRSSPTNMGLALISALCALELGIDKGKALPLIMNMLDTMEKLPKWKGHFYNWYDTLSLRPLSPRYVSTVDSGNLCASLIVLKNGLISHHRPALAKRVSALISPMDFAPLYDSRRCLFRIGADIDKGELSPAHYDLFAGETRLTSYLAVAKGDVPKKHWRSLSRALRRCDGYTGMASWTGTMFEYLMPELFLPLCPDSLIYEALRYCLHVQKKRKSKSGLWGISESAYYSLDSALSYRYKAHGCADLALKRGQDRELVISPYSSFLALTAEPKAALKNLHRLEAAGAVGRYGFIEAIDFTPSRSGEKGEKVRCYMVHHLGMSMLALTNLLTNGAVIKYFMAEPSLRAYRALLEEKLPVNAPVLQLAEEKKMQNKKPAPWLLRGSDVDFESPCLALLSNGRYNIMSTESGISRAALGDLLIYRPPRDRISGGHGAELIFETGGHRLNLLPSPAENFESCLWELGENRTAHSLCRDGFESTCTLAVSGRENGELRTVTLRSEVKISGRLLFTFEPVLANYNDYVNHPAYWRLGLIAHAEGNILAIRRLPRGNLNEHWLCLACSEKMSFSADRCVALGALSAPFVTAAAELELSPGESSEVRFALCVAEDFSDAFAGAQRMLASSTSDYGVIPSLCAARLGLTASEYGKTMELARALLFPRQVQKPRCAKEKLWPYGISGDFPLCLVPLNAEEEKIKAAVLRFCLLRLCGVSADLAILSNDTGEYDRPVHNLVVKTLSGQGLEPLLGAKGGVHILPGTADDTLRSCAAFVFGEAPAVRRANAHYYLPQIRSRKQGAAPKYEFSDNGSFKFYVNQNLPSRTWANILTNGCFGYLATDCGTGNMWLSNAREARISPWCNDLYSVTGPETLEYVINGQRRSLFAASDGLPCRVSFGFGYAVWEKKTDDAAFRCTAFVPEDTDARVFILESSGDASGQIAWQLPLTLSDSEADALAVSEYYVNSIFHASSERFPFEGELMISASEAPLGWTGDGFSALRGEYEGKTGHLSVPCFAALYAARPVLILCCGFCSEAEILKLCKPEFAFSQLERVQAKWRKILSFRLTGADSALCRYMSGWAAYQTIACRLLGRCSVYQSGGAFGFRDQLQDAVNLLLLSPKYAREQIRLCCRHQYAEGDVMHWWHALPGGDKGVRTRCSDDLLWLVWALCEYTEKTGDLSLCEELECYVNSPVLTFAEHDRYETPEISDDAETILCHARRAADLCIARGTGAHGLMKFGSGDWNDGMDKVDGESVWLSFFFACVLKRFSDLLLQLGKGDGEYYRGIAEKLCRSADEAWDGAWYLRGYWPDGEPLGSCQNSECRIDSIVQSWAAFCPGTTNSRVDTALQSALMELYDREKGITMLFAPPFSTSKRDPGYIRSYGPGFRENGGQYTHAAIWLAMACLRRGREKDGLAILLDMLPENRDIRSYMAEPFVLAADIYSNPLHSGEAGWTWYTGSAGWYFRAVTEELLGLKLWGGSLYIRPNLPVDFPPVTMQLGSLKIELSRGNIFVNGEKYDGKGIPYGE